MSVRSVEDAAPASLAIDDQGCVVRWSAEAELMFGWAAHEAMGRPLTATIVPRYFSEGHRTGLERVRRTGRSAVVGRTVEVRARRRDGTEFPVQMVVLRVPRPDGGINYEAVLRDITRMRRLDRLGAMQLAVSRALMRTPDVEPALHQVLHEVAAAFGAQAAMLWLPDQPGAPPRLRHSWSAPSTALATVVERANLDGLPQIDVMRRVWRDRIPFVVVAGSPHHNALLTAAEEAGQRWMGAFPLAGPEPMAGALVLLSPVNLAVDEDTLMALASVAGQVGHALATSRAEQAMRQSELQYRALFESTPDPIVVCDLATRNVLAVNRAAVARYGYSAEEFVRLRLDDIHVGRVPDHVVAPPDGDDRSSPGPAAAEHRLRDGRVIDVQLTTRRELFQGREAVLVLVHEVTDLMALQRDLWRQAFHDSLTGLANRALFLDRLGHSLRRSGRGGRPCAVLLLDVDDFKAVNDSLGHLAGDALLRGIGGRLAGALRTGDTVARLGGDEFAILLDGVSEDQAREAAERLLASLSEPFPAADKELIVRASIGIAVDGGTALADEVLRNADLAMYVAKARGKHRYQVFAPAMHTAVVERLTFEHELRRALVHDELRVHYQPVVDIASGRIEGAEALVRWQHPTRGLLAPDAFIPLAEETGLIHAIGDWVLTTACAQAQAWTRLGLGDPRVAVNLSGRELAAAGVADRVRRTLEQTGLAARRLELEITEYALVDESVIAQIEELRAHGVRVAIDDFGTGYSMLKRLQMMPVDRLKIDKSFIDAVALGVDPAPLVGAMITLGHSLDLEVVAEGVENCEQLAFLRRHRCDLVQGHLVSPAVPAADCEALLRRSNAGHSVVTWPEPELDGMAVLAELLGGDADLPALVAALRARLAAGVGEGAAREAVELACRIVAAQAQPLPPEEARS